MGDRFAIYFCCGKSAATPAEFLRDQPAALKFDKEFKEPY